jgi:hypothetical protein
MGNPNHNHLCRYDRDSDVCDGKGNLGGGTVLLYPEWQMTKIDKEQFDRLFEIAVDERSTAQQVKNACYLMKAKVDAEEVKSDIIEKRKDFIEQMDDNEKQEYGEWKNRKDFKREEA